MAFESRPDSRTKYLYRSVRQGGRIKKEYLGPASDPAVRIIARQDELLQLEQKAAWEEARQAQADFKRLESLIVIVEKHVISRVKALPNAGCPAPVKSLSSTTNTARRQSDSIGDGKMDEPTREQFDHLVHQSQKGDRQAIAELKRLIRSQPDTWQPVGDLARHAEESLITQISEGNPVLEESLRIHLGRLKDSLRTESDNPVISLLVDFVRVTWLETHYARAEADQPWRFVRDARFWEQRHARAVQRHLTALRELHEWRQKERRMESS